MFDAILTAAASCFTPINLLAIILSTTLGIIIGALPGFGATTGLIIVLPLTFSMDPGTALVTLTGIYVGAEYGGSISSILLNTPGTGGAVVTCFDGFPMAQKGKAREALFISNIASFSGGIVGGLTMLLFMPILARFALEFGAGEILLLSIMGLLLVGTISNGDPLKGILSASLGVFITCVGADPFLGLSRYDFGTMILIGGLPFIPVMLGVFSIPYMIQLVLEGSGGGKTHIDFRNHGMRDNATVFLRVARTMFSRMKWLLVKSGLIGVGIGAIPGVGGSVSTMVAYSAAKNASRHPEEFGHGSMEGVAAPESSNNGLVGGSLIPVLTLGIPGSPSAAIFMGAIFMHGMTPGPNFMTEQAPLAYMLILSIFFCALVQLTLGFISIGSLTNVLRVPVSRLFPAIVLICGIGAYVVRGLEFDIYLFTICGFILYILSHIGFNAGAFILGMILGSETERALLEALTIAQAKGGLLSYYCERPIALGLLALLLAYGIWRVWKELHKDPCRDLPEQECMPGSWKGLRGCDAVFSVLCLGFLAVLFYMSFSLPEKLAIFPRLTLTVAGTSMLVLLGKSLFWAKAYYGSTQSPFAGLPFGKLGVLAGSWLIYLLGIKYLGFYSSSFLMMSFYTNLIRAWEQKGRVSPKEVVKNTVFSFVFTAICYVVFKYFFQVTTPVPFLV